MKEHNNIELIDSYFRDELSKEERLEFEKKLKNNQKFKQFFEEQKFLIAAVESYSRTKMDADLRKVQQEFIIKRQIKKDINKKLYMYIPAAAVLFMLFGFFLNFLITSIKEKKNVVAIVERNFNEQPLYEYVIKNNTKVKTNKIESIKISGFEAFKNRDWLKAIENFENYLNNSESKEKEDFTLNLYLGRAYMELDQVDKSISCFQKGINKLEDDINYIYWVEDMKWQMALAIMKNGDVKKGKIILIDLCHSKKESIREKACNFLKEIL